MASGSGRGRGLDSGRKARAVSIRRAKRMRISTRLYTVPVEGGPAEVLPMWRGEDAWFSPDATRIAYVPERNLANRLGSAIAAGKQRQSTSCD